MLIAVPLGVNNSVGIGSILIDTGNASVSIHDNTKVERRGLVALIGNASLLLVCQEILVGEVGLDVGEAVLIL